MALTSNVMFLLALCIGSALAGAQDPKRPSLEEYKDAKAADAENKTATAANSAKMSGVNKVVEMLENLQQQVIDEGEKEAKTYDKFACFCRDMTKEKTSAIKKGKDKVEELSASIRKLSTRRDKLDTKIGKLNTDIEDAEKAMATLKSESDDALSVYEKNEADLSGAIFGVKEATKVLKASGKASLLEIQSAKETVKTALMLADALGLEAAKSPSLVLLQGAPDVEMEDYKFHSGGIIETLEKLTQDFVDEKNKVDAAEVKRVQEFDMAKQKNTDLQKAKNVELDDSKAEKDQTVEDIAEASQELTTVSATLADDQKYLAELSQGCSDKAKTWDQRSKVRVQELTAITEATDIIKATVAEKTSSSTIRFAQTGSILHTADAVVNNENALEAIEEEAEETPLGFLQKRKVDRSVSMLSIFARKHQAAVRIAAPDDTDVAKQMVVSMLKNNGMKLKSTLLLSLATQIGSDPFAKIKKLIQELIERLLTEAANEANQKGWCDKAMADAEQKRDMSADKADELNAKMAKLEAARDKLTEELKVLAEDILSLKEAQTEALKNRKEEKAENKETVYEAKAGLEATNKAMQILSKFYGTAAKATIDLSLAQGPFDDAPDAGFKNGEAYTAAGSDSGGIVGMLEVIASDFVRTISETESAEASAEADQLKFMTESSASLAEKTMAQEQNTKYKNEAETSLDEADTALATQTDILTTSIEELMKLKETCIDTGMSYADRVAMREQEIASLKKALCIFGAYAQFGPDGLGDAC